MTIAVMVLKFTLRNQGQESKLKGNAVGLSSIVNRGHFSGQGLREYGHKISYMPVVYVCAIYFSKMQHYRWYNL